MVWSVRYVLVVLLVFAAPTASAQEAPYLELAVTPNDGGVLPVTGVGKATVDVTLKCEQGALYPSVYPLKVDLEAASDQDWFLALLDKETLAFEMTPADCAPGHEDMQSVDVHLSATEDAGAGDRAVVTLKATPENGTAVEISWNETAGVVHATKARLDKSVHQMRAGQGIDLKLLVQNDGNGPVDVTLEQEADNPAGIEFVFPQEETQVEAGEEGEILVQVFATKEAFDPDETTARLAVTTTSTVDATVSQTDVVTAALKLDFGAVDESGTPLFGPLIVALSAMALLRRRH